MASSKVMASTSRANPDLPRQSSISSSLSTLISDLQDPNKNASAALDHTPTTSSMTMDDLLKNIYSDNPPTPDPPIFHGGGGDGSKTVDEVWKEIVAGSGRRGGSRGEVEEAETAAAAAATATAEEEMTLEDFLTKSGAVREEDVRVCGDPGNYCVDAATGDLNGQMIQMHGTVAAGIGTSVVGNNNGINVNGGDDGIDGRIAVAVGTGRGKRRAVEEPVDKATQQKQRRMIKNRESAARSRERKQAYTAELESQVTQLEEENAQLLREEAQQSKERLKQLVKNLIPVVESRRPRPALRRVNSMHW